MKGNAPVLERIQAVIPEARLSLGLSRPQLAAMAGVAENTIDRIERGYGARPLTLTKIAIALTVAELFSDPASVVTVLHSRAMTGDVDRYSDLVGGAA
jgi:transcriptional regulator with XRE-family HTH domain